MESFFSHDQAATAATITMQGFFLCDKEVTYKKRVLNQKEKLFICLQCEEKNLGPMIACLAWAACLPTGFARVFGRKKCNQLKLTVLLFMGFKRIKRIVYLI